MFSKILIANRGEIAVRIIRACKEMGIATVAVFSEADRDALHVSLADESYCIGPAPVGESYLNMAAVISAAVCSGAQAIHPGYGLLSENARFAALCEECSITFIGPRAETIAKAGDKDAARKTMRAAGVPVIPGCDAVADFADARKQAQKIGFPLLIKARSGGGGRGIRLVHQMDELETAYQNASREAQSAFGDGGVYLEKYLYPAKHIEMQVLCDDFGNVVCLGERECSIQRKNQKLIEECPSSGMDEKTRQRMMKAAETAARAVGYRNAGTVEFLLDRDGNFYFMEMNTRLQVEHTVTEMVTGFDLVKWQIRIAAGQPLGFEQKDVHLDGHAIECRLLGHFFGQHARRQLTGRHAAHVAQNAVGHLLQIGLAFAQIGVFHLIELARDLLELRHQRPFGVVEPLGNPVPHARCQHLVLQQHEVHFQQGCKLARRIGGQIAHQALQLIDHRIARMARTGDFCLHLRCFDKVVWYFNAAGSHDHSAPDRNTARNRQPVDGKCHVLVLLDCAQSAQS